MIQIGDIHTHILPRVKGSALVCVGCGPLPREQGHFFSVGLHPWHVTGDDQVQLRAVEDLLSLPQVLAVGECGFDKLRGPSRNVQEQAFKRQFELSELYGKPMVLHVVREFDTVIRLRKSLKPRQKWLIHGFRGGPEQMRQLQSNGMSVSFGINPNPDTLRQVSPDMLYLETDGKVPFDDVVRNASAVRMEPPETILEYVSVNNRRFLGD